MLAARFNALERRQELRRGDRRDRLLAEVGEHEVLETLRPLLECGHGERVAFDFEVFARDGFERIALCGLHGLALRARVDAISHHSTRLVAFFARSLERHVGVDA